MRVAHLSTKEDEDNMVENSTIHDTTCLTVDAIIQALGTILNNTILSYSLTERKVLREVVIDNMFVFEALVYKIQVS